MGFDQEPEHQPDKEDWERYEKLRDMDKYIPGWRDMKHENGKPKFSDDGTMLDESGNRSIFDDVDE